MHILVTNDDGIESAGLHVLAQRLTQVGEVHFESLPGSDTDTVLAGSVSITPLHSTRAAAN